MVSSVPSIPGSRNKRIRISVNSPLKKLHRTTTKYDAVIVFAEVLNRARGIYYRTCVTRSATVSSAL